MLSILTCLLPVVVERKSRKDSKLVIPIKAMAIISVNPLNSDSIAKISYGYDGKVKSDDSDIEQDLNDTLNLNVEKLKRNRLESLESYACSDCEKKSE